MVLSDGKTLRAGPARIIGPRSGAGVKGGRVNEETAGRSKADVLGAAANPVPLPGRRSSAAPCPPLAGTAPLVFKGYLATVTLWPGRVQIDRTFVGRINGNYSVSIPWQRVTGIDFLDPTRVVNGHVHVAVDSEARGLAAADSGRWRGGATGNPHAIMFTWRQRVTYESLRDLLTANQASEGPRSLPPRRADSFVPDSRRASVPAACR
jgi:hypothetical protein